LAGNCLESNIKQVNPLLVFACLIFVAVTLYQGSAALANDTLVRIGAGGITFVKSEDIRMLEEVLHISMKQVKVKYRFVNESDKDIHATVAFPLPAPNGKFAEQMKWYIDRFKSSFVVLVNGNPVPAKSQNADAVVWQQSFPARKEIVVEHIYAPIPGGDIDIMPSMTEAGFFSRIRDRVFFYLLVSNSDGCLDSSTRRGIENQATSLGASGSHVYLVTRHIEYILGTGRNWKGPIGKFTLRIEKEAPEDFLSLCFPGKLNKVSSTLLEFVQNDFVPPDKLVVYFYTVRP